MCTSIRLKNKDILSVKEFEDHFKVNAEKFKHKSYGFIDKQSCLCQIDLVKFFADKTDKFEYNTGEYWEI